MNERAPDIMPSVSMSLGYGEYVDSLDVDIAGIVEYLRARGISDDEIESLQIHFSDQDGEDETSVTYAQYQGSSDTVEMLSLDAIRKAYRTAHTLYDGLTAKQLNEYLVHELQHKIAKNDEELQDKARIFFAKMKRMTIIRGMGSVSIGAGAGVGAIAIPQINEALAYPDIYGISPLKVLGLFAVAEVVMRGVRKVWPLPSEQYVYMNDPEEMHVREVTEASDEQFVALQPKQIGYVTPEHIEYSQLILEVLDEISAEEDGFLSTSVAHEG